jgi:copper transport protein
MAPSAVSSAPQPAPAKPAEFVLRWLGLAGLTVVVGGLLVALLVAPRLPDRGQQSRVQAALFGLALAGNALQLVSGTALLAVQGTALGPDLTHTVPRLVTDSEYGSRWLVSTMLSVALTMFIGILWRRTARGGVTGLAQEFRRLGPLALLSSQARTVILAVALAAAAAVSGHAAGAAGLTAGEVVLRTTHLLSVGVWAGGVIALTVALLVLRVGERSGEGVRRLVLGFGPYAAVGFAPLGVTGLLLSGTQVASLTALLSTSYGLVLVAKVAVTALVATVALRHALFTWRNLGRRSQPELPPRILLPTVALEGGGALAVILLAAVLGSSAPARGPQFDPQSPTAPATQVTRQSGELVTAVSLKPNRRGPNLLSVQVVDSRRPPLAAITGVTVLLRHPGGPVAGEPLATTRSGSRFDAGSVDLSAGDLQIGVVVHRSGLSDSVIEVPWSVGAPEVPRTPTVISAEPLAPAVQLGAVLLVLAAALMLLCGVMRYRLGDGVRGATHRDEGGRPVRRRILSPGRTLSGIPGLNRTNGP